MSVIIKRGCSEYPISFPDYKKINKSGPQLMNYNENWESVMKRGHILLFFQNTYVTPSDVESNADYVTTINHDLVP